MKKVLMSLSKAKAEVRNRVKELREAKAWSVSRLAREAGVVSATVSNMEKGIPTRRDSQLKVAKALGKRHEEVFPEVD
jgi:DNA-binding XRE family transcriptional regulator